MMRVAAHQIVPIFQTSKLELVRLLHQAAEVEHALLVQYLYAAFSVKDIYPSIHGFPMAGAGTLMGVAIQEMQHLDAVNRFLVALGASPNLAREDFPWEIGIYPFPLHLEPLTPQSLAKYVFTEAPAGVFEPGDPAYDAALAVAVSKVFGGNPQINHVGSLYGRIIALAGDVQAKPAPGQPDLSPHIARMQSVRAEGETAHFAFFKSLFDGTHPGFNGVADPWGLNPADPRYPSLDLPRDPSVVQGGILNPDTLAMSQFANLHYWLTILLIDGYYRFADDDLLSLAKAHMLGPVLGVGTLLAAGGQGVPFDALDTGTAPGLTESALATLCLLMLDEADQVIVGRPAPFAGFDNSQSQATRAQLHGKV